MKPDLSLAAQVAHRARIEPGAGGIVDDDDAVMTIGEVVAAAASLATALTGHGVRAGDRGVWAGRNHPGLLLTLVAAQWIGAVFVPVSFRATPSEVAASLELCGASLVITHPGAVDQLTQVAGRIPVLTWAAALTEAAPARRRPADPDEPAVLLFSSGTTGRPKAVVLSHANLWWSARNLETAIGAREADTTLAVAPMFHVGGLNCFAIAALGSGGRVVLRSGFDPARILADLQSGVTTVFGVPAMYAAIAREPAFATADLSGVRAAVVGGAAVPRPVLAAYRERGLTLLPSWGMSETAPAGTLLPAALVADKPCSVGYPLPLLEVELRDPATGEVVADPGTTAEVEELVVVGGPDETWGEAAVAVAQTSAPLQIEDVRAAASPSLAHFKLPKRVVTVDRLPRLASGKVDRRATRRLAADLLGLRDEDAAQTGGCAPVDPQN